MFEKAKTTSGRRCSMLFFGLFYDKTSDSERQLGYILFFSVYGIDVLSPSSVDCKKKIYFSHRSFVPISQ
jgi:hypothetical protein